MDSPPPEVPAPALEPRETPEQQVALRQQIANLQAQLRERIAQLSRSRLSETDRKTLEDARMFLGQSERALEVADLQRSLNLARKASLLVSAVETKP